MNEPGARRILPAVSARVPFDRRAVVEILRSSGAKFAFVHGSRAGSGESARPDSDLDVAAYWGRSAPGSWEVLLPSRVDLLVLDDAPLELRGRVALHGELLFDDDPPARVRWQAMTRKIYLDEGPRQRRLDRIFREARRGR